MGVVVASRKLFLGEARPWEKKERARASEEMKMKQRTIFKELAEKP